ncbi:hypothetical protein LXL04_007980 [Taraxacum kok-saghyz]
MSTRGKRTRINPNHEGVEFVNNAQRAKFDQFLDSRLVTQKFPDEADLHELGVWEEVYTLFPILVCWIFKRPTIEFLSSVYQENNILHFRLMNRNYQISIDDIYAIIDALTTRNFPNKTTLMGITLPPFGGVSLRDPITSQMPLNPPKSSIRSCVLLIAYTHETSTIPVAELQILYCMACNTVAHTHFGANVAKRLSSLRPGTKGSKHLCIGRVVTMLAYALDVPFPGLEGLSDPRFTIPVLTASKLFDRHQDDYFATYTTPHFSSPPSPVIFVTSPPPSSSLTVTGENPHSGGISEDEDEDDDSDGQNHPATSSGAEPSHTTRSPPYPPYHQSYLNHFQTIEQNISNLDSYAHSI